MYSTIVPRTARILVDARIDDAHRAADADRLARLGSRRSAPGLPRRVVATGLLALGHWVAGPELGRQAPCDEPAPAR